MSNDSTPTFVIVPGHWHVKAHLTPLVDVLTSRGFRAVPLQLHSVGPKSTRPTFSDDVCVIYSAVARELIRGNDVCLVVHSYAGMPGAEAINRICSDEALEGLEGRGKLIKAVFIAAYAFPANFVMDVRAMLGPENPAFDIDNDNILHILAPWHHLFNDLPLSAAKPWVDTLAPTYYLGPSFTFAPTTTTQTPSIASAALSPTLSPSRHRSNRSPNPSTHRPSTPTANTGSTPFASNNPTPRTMSPAPANSMANLPLSRPSTPTTQRQKNDAAGPVISSDKWRKAPLKALLCRKDNLISAERQEKIWKGIDREWVEAGHACFVSKPEEVADCLVRAVEADGGEFGVG